MKYIKLTMDNEASDACYIRAESIVCFYGNKEIGSSIEYSCGTDLEKTHVKEPPEEVRERLASAFLTAPGIPTRRVP